MKVYIILLICLGLFIHPINLEEDSVLEFVVQMAFDAALDEAKQIGNVVLLQKVSATIPMEIPDILTGTFGFNDFMMYGLDTVDHQTSLKLFKEDKGGVLERSVTIDSDIKLGKIGVRSDYNINCELVGFPALNAQGEFQYQLTDVSLKGRITVVYGSFIEIKDTSFTFGFGSTSESYITGFPHFETLSFLTSVINNLEAVIKIWFDKDKPCLECTTTRVVRYGVDLLLTGRVNKYEKCNCPQDNDFFLISMIESYLESLEDLDLQEVLKNFSNFDRVKTAITDFKQIVDKISRRHGKLKKRSRHSLSRH